MNCHSILMCTFVYIDIKGNDQLNSGFQTKHKNHYWVINKLSFNHKYALYIYVHRHISGAHVCDTSQVKGRILFNKYCISITAFIFVCHFVNIIHIYFNLKSLFYFSNSSWFSLILNNLNWSNPIKNSDTSLERYYNRLTICLIYS